MTITLVILAIVLYLMIGRAAYRKIIVPTRYREALDGDLDAMVSVIHAHEKSLVYYLSYGGWLLFYPVLFILGWCIARLGIDI